MTKRTGIIYTFLFLFVFTFALSFTLATQAQADQEPCCPVWYCYGDPDAQDGWGHFVKNVGCVRDGTHGCDFWFRECLW